MNKMKIIISIFFISVFTVFSTNAQKKLNDLTLNYTVSLLSLSGKSGATTGLEGAKLDIYIKGTQSRSDMVSSLGSESSIYDSKTGNGFILKEYSGQKLMITLNKKNWIQKNKFYREMKFSIEQTDKVITGYSCKKALATTESGNDFVIYFTDEFITSGNEYINGFSNLPGIPLQYEVQTDKMKFVYTLTGMSTEKISDSKFEEPKAGYRLMTYDENLQLKKGGK